MKKNADGASAQREHNWDAMAVIQKELEGILGNVSLHGPARLNKVVERAWQMLHMGPFILPTPEVKDTYKIFNGHLKAFKRFVKLLDKCSCMPEIPNESAERLIDIKVSLETEIEVLERFGKLTRTLDPNSKEAKKLAGQTIRSFSQPYPKNYQPQEMVKSDVIGANQCQVVLKEFHGMILKIQCKIIPIWVEPWYSRAKIVGYKKIWYIEYVPAEFIKRIVTCYTGCADDPIKRYVYKDIIEEPELNNFQYYFQAPRCC